MVIRRNASIALLAAVAACSHKVTSPSMSAGKVQPDLVCREQITTRVTLTGSGFTPMPTDTLKTSRLILPSIVLARAKDLTGAAAGGETTPIPDDPAAPASSLVHWTSTEEMSFDVAPSLQLQPGFYDIQVTNPDGKSSVTFALGLAAVSRPVVSSADRAAICDAQGAQTVVLTGTGFLTVGGAVPTVKIGTKSNADFTSVSASGCTSLPGTFAEGPVGTCTTLTVVIPAGLFAPGDYPVTVTNPPPADCASSDVVTLHVEPPPIVTGTVPVTLCQGGGTLVVNGSGFLPPATVELSPVTAGPPALFSASSTVNGSGTQIAATFGGGGVPPNKYDVIVDNHDGCTDAAPHQQVTVVTGPVAFFADPEVVYNGIQTTLTVYVTTITWPVTTFSIVPHGASTPVTSLTPIPVPGHPNRVQGVIPAGLAVGAYDLFLNDATSCGSVLPSAITVTSTTTVSLKAVTPAFGWTGASTAVTVQRDTAAAPPNDQVFVATPRLFLTPRASPASPAIQVQSVSFVNGDTLTAVVPSGQAVGAYDLVLVNPDGTVGVLSSAFQVTANPPPVVAAVTPSSIVNATGQVVTVKGSSFDATNGSTVTLACKDTTGASLAAPPVVTGTVTCATPSSCSVPATVNASGLPSTGALCVLRLTNNGDGSFFDYSAIGVTNASLNLAKPPFAGSTMTKGRRALVAAAGNATPASRFVYAVGGDGGAATPPLVPYSDVEVASVDLFGNMGPWSIVPRSSLVSPRAFAGSATVGRYIYLFGGIAGAESTTTVPTAERAMILDPAEVPQLDIGDVVAAPTGLDPGYWIYRVSAVFSGTDPDNPSGESLPSDEAIIKVPSFPGKKIQVVLAWQAPKDSLGVTLPNIAGYDVYRTPVVNGVSGAEVLLAFVPGASAVQYTDDGSAVPGTQAPLPFGSLGRWAPLPNLNVARRALAGAAAFDPVTSGRFYVYALLGLDATNTPLTSYELLPVTIQPNGHQTVGASWALGAAAVTAGRSQLGAWVADSVTSSAITAPDTFVYLGGGLESTNVDAGKVAAGGDLGTFSAVKKFGGTQAGYGVCAANGQLFAFGGGNAAPSQGATSAGLVSPAPALAANSWNAEGITLLSPRYLSGSAVQSAFIFLVGGQTPAGGANDSTELVIW